MNDYNITDDLVDEIRDQFRIWALFLNNGIGILSFTFGLASLGTTIPWINALISLVLIILIRWQGKHYFPDTIKTLRKESKSNKKARILLKELETEFLGLKILLKDYPIFLFGFSFLFVIVLSPIWVDMLPVLGPYFGFLKV